MTTCDIIIPAYNSSQVLPRTVQALFAQEIANPWSPRLIIADDGSTDTTSNVSREISPPHPWRPTLFVEGPHTGSAGARNRGLKHAAADIILFLGADIILRPTSLHKHLSFHTTHRAITDAALGMVRWDPRLNPSPLMEWLTHGGSQNNFDALLGETKADPAHYFYGSHLSLKAKAIQNRWFSDNYTAYGWEDLDFGRSLARQLTLNVLHDAVGLHHHYYTVGDVYRRQHAIGRNLVTYQQHYPDVPLLPSRPWRHQIKHKVVRITGALELSKWLLVHIFPSLSLPKLFSRVTSAQLWQGVYTKAKVYP